MSRNSDRCRPRPIFSIFFRLVPFLFFSTLPFIAHPRSYLRDTDRAIMIHWLDCSIIRSASKRGNLSPSLGLNPSSRVFCPIMPARM
ncbi:hypothetical protein K461DRAFT_316528 [Myriangium duriaei CBS 260.36]|uniref:Uncharacterized protein n=1 Tax=Myriangium duriaei CBS 260.36 TaxID=1168546 RepID=A0A9P4ITC1_9PEZI|nr:hypothetical protein K461DRAFT_316528 [Myriangium duriaei CBS 260.36]